MDVFLERGFFFLVRLPLLKICANLVKTADPINLFDNLIIKRHYLTKVYTE